MKIYVYGDLKTDWYPRNAVETFQRFSSVDFCDRPEDSDLIWYFSYYIPPYPLLYPWDRVWGKLALRGLGWQGPFPRYAPFVKEKVVWGSLHHLTRWKESEWRGKVDRLGLLCDVVQFFSRCNAVIHRDRFPGPVALMPYWIDLDRYEFRAAAEQAAIRRGLGLPEDKKLIGSFQRDTEVNGKPKLEKGPDLLLEAADALADPGDYHFVVAGTRRDYVTEGLARRGIAFTDLGMVPQSDMTRLYHALDWYWVCSREEGGPQAILEAAATGTPILSLDVGVASDVLHPDAVCQSPGEVAKRTDQGARDECLDFQFEQVRRHHDVRKVVEQYESSMAQAVEVKRKFGFLTDDLVQRHVKGVDWLAHPK